MNGNQWLKHKVKPYPESSMSTEKLANNTICGVLRDIYKLTNNPEVKLLARIGVSMAKKMSNRLHFYHNNYEE